MRLERFTENGGGSWTVVWLPSFLSDAMEKLLGELVILEHILETRDTARGYVAELSVENQSRALTDLENLRSAKRQRLMLVLEQAYGLASVKEGDLDSSRAIDRHQHRRRHLLSAGTTPSSGEVVLRILPQRAGPLQVTADDGVAGTDHHAARSIAPLFT
jgi:predicted component of type VI protein secretion system